MGGRAYPVLIVMDYRIFALLTLVCWGVWGFLAKVLTRRTAPETVALWSTLASILPIMSYAAITGTAQWVRSAPLAMVSGFFAGVATVCFYLAMKGGPASVVLPLTGMYIVIPAILGYLVLKEPVNIQHLFGLLFAVLAVVFLSR